MAKVRVHELAKELKISSKELIGYLEQLKVDAKSHMSVIEEDTAAVVKELVSAAQGGSAKPAATAPAVPAAPAAPAAAPAGEAPAAAKAKKYVKGSKPAPRAPYPRRGRGNEPFVIGDKSEMVIRVDAPLSVKELAEKLTVNPTVIIKKLITQGLMVNINQELDVAAAQSIVRDLGFQLEEVKPAEEKVQVAGTINTGGRHPDDDDPALLQFRPPVVTVMGHVDHGKTSLLDAIRQANVTASEAGGITQHIGAYVVDLKGKKIVFIDTPGHEAFTAMRARGAQATDIAVLVVAADDGIMPQTIEAINHAKAAQVPIVVAINKIDRPNANVERVKQQLTEYGLVSEEWGGDTVIVPVSAREKIGIENLLEMILLVAEMQEIKANPNRPARGIIIEAELDKGRGPVATVLIKSGTLKIGDGIIAGMTYGKVRAMLDDKGKMLKKAGPSTPVSVLGLSDVPQAGDQMNAVEDEKHARAMVEAKLNSQKEAEFNKSYKATLDNLFARIKEGTVKELNLVIKADVQGSVEAVKQSLEKLTNQSVRVNIIHGGVGTITESDVMLAMTSSAIIIGFNVRPDTNARKMAEAENVDIRTYRIIYEAIDEITAAMEGMLEPEFKEVVLGRATVRQLFKVPKAGTIAGCQVQDGKILRNADVRVIRNGAVIHQGTVASLKRFKDDVREVLAGFECGIGLDKFNDLKEGDILEAFAMQEVK